MKELLAFIISSITGSKEFEIEENQEDDRIDLNVKISKDLIGLVIGKNGKTIQAMRNILKVKGVKENKVVFINVTESWSVFSKTLIKH